MYLLSLWYLASQVLVALAALNYFFFLISSSMKKALLAFLLLNSCTLPLPRIHKCLKVLAPLATYQCLHIDFFLNQAFLIILSSFGLLQSVPSQQEAKSTFFISSGEYKILIMKTDTITKEERAMRKKTKVETIPLRKSRKAYNKGRT